MKKMIFFLSFVLGISIVGTQKVRADMGDFGFFGGITDGKRLPKTTEILISNNSKNRNKRGNTQDEYVYKELIFLSGKPIEFEGLLTVKSSGKVEDDKDFGSYTTTYEIRPGVTKKDDVSLTRNIIFDVKYRREKDQIIKDYEVKNWTEVVYSDGENYIIDPKQSEFGLSVLEDHTAGVVYYKGNISKKAVYTKGSTKDSITTLDSAGEIYGYDSAWSRTETHRIDATISSTDNWQLQYQVRPSVSVNKVIQYGQNEPTAISFKGNYREVMQNQSGMQYDIFAKPAIAYDVEPSGKVDIQPYNSFEQLIAPNTEFLKGHFAEADIKKLFSMQILEGEPKYYLPDQTMTRGQFITALTKAIKLPVQETEIDTTKKASKKKKEEVTIVFSDVTPQRPEYPYIMAAFRTGVAVSRENGKFYMDSPIERQEAFALLTRTLGLGHLGLDPTPVTMFTDDHLISDWARKELYSANKIGVISGDDDGNIRPKEFITKAEGAALINRLVSYMRTGLPIDYTEHIVNYSN